MAYQHAAIEAKWQEVWETTQPFKADNGSLKPKYYVLDMFPYPSAAGLHVGHPEGYTATDIIARYKRAKGFNVLHPIGWDAFGLPAEQYAIQTGVHPVETTTKAIATFKRQLKSLGFSYDWSREISTCDPNYYRWTQYIFLKLYEKGLAYQKEVAVNWCPNLKTVLANEEVLDGKSERGGHPVHRVPMKQWMLKITDYADRLLADLDKLDWPEGTKERQREWIGKQSGEEIFFPLELDPKIGLSVFIDDRDLSKIKSISKIVLSPENSSIGNNCVIATHFSCNTEVSKYIETAKKKSERQRQTDKNDGVFTGRQVMNPVTGKVIPIYICDNIVGEGATAIFSITISPFSTEEASKAAMMQKRRVVKYKFRDWLFSRQRYWGEPLPIIYDKDGKISTISENELPVLLPDVKSYEPSGTGRSPLETIAEWVSTPNGNRETDTMPGSAGSSWYFLRYLDPYNQNIPFSLELEKYWMPVDLYIGGPEHAVGHLLYARFWTKVLFDLGLVTHDEPFQKLFHQGMILGEDGEKMSKSGGNAINPDEVVGHYGADTLRLYLMSMGPLDRDKSWSTTAIEGAHRLLQRLWRVFYNEADKLLITEDPLTDDDNKILHQTIKKVTQDTESLQFNTAISQLTVFVNYLTKESKRNRELVKPFVQLLHPYAPHLAEELWSGLGYTDLMNTPWPDFDSQWAVEEFVTLPIQIMGKLRATVPIGKDTPQSEVEVAAKAAVKEILTGKSIKKVIYVPGKIINFIIGD